MDKIVTFLKNEIVLIISLVLALISMIFVSPDREYIGYIDFRTLALLFSLMTVMAGVNKLGMFSKLAQSLLSRVKTLSGLTLVFVLICFFSSMMITNDVALITFVPFTVITLKLADRIDKMFYIVTLETISANLGSMLTPIGNPQNLYLYSAFNMKMSDFFITIIPYAFASLVSLIVLSLVVDKGKINTVSINNENNLQSKKLTIMYLLLFIVCVLCVVRVLHFAVALVTVVVVVFLFDRKALAEVDYSLLLTFVFLFIFIGNLGRIEAVNSFLSNAVNGNEVLVAIAMSQVISNVPAAILLSGFTRNICALLIGVNIGGLGTLIASMASLISFKFVQKEKKKTAEYFIVFSALNVLFLIINLAVWLVIK